MGWGQTPLFRAPSLYVRPFFLDQRVARYQSSRGAHDSMVLKEVRVDLFRDEWHELVACKMQRHTDLRDWIAFGDLPRWNRKRYTSA